MLLTIFSHPAMSSDSCRNFFASVRRMLTKLHYPAVIMDSSRRMLTRLHYPAVIMDLSRPDAMKKFKKMEGYLWMAMTHFNGDMRRTYLTVRKILGEEKFQLLRWRLFNGTVLEYQTVLNILIDQETGEVNPDYIGQDKVGKFAEQFGIHRLVACHRAYEALGWTKFAVLDWKIE